MANESFIMAKAFNIVKNIDDSSLSAFCKKQRIKKLPKDYADFLIKYNGGSPKTDSFKLDNCPEIDSGIISVFFRLDDKSEFNSLLYAIEMFGGRLPNDVLPIARDTYGNILMIGIHGDLEDNIFIWIHDRDWDDSSQGSWENIYKISDSFYQFIHSLTESDISSTDNDKLEDICRKGDLSKLDKLLNDGLSPDSCVKSGHTLIEVCAGKGHSELVKILINYGAMPGRALPYALMARKEETSLYLLQHTDDPKRIMPHGSTWLHFAAEYNLPKVAKYLLDNGCPVNEKDGDGLSALAYAADDSEKKITAKIIKDAGGIEIYE